MEAIKYARAGYTIIMIGIRIMRGDRPRSAKHGGDPRLDFTEEVDRLDVPDSGQSSLFDPDDSESDDPPDYSIVCGQEIPKH